MCKFTVFFLFAFYALIVPHDCWKNSYPKASKVILTAKKDSNFNKGLKKELSPKEEIGNYVSKLFKLATTGLVSISVSHQVLADTTELRSPDSKTTLKDPIITDKIYLDVKIANYTEESIGKNKGATGSGRLIVGLYGKEAPKTVAQFLSLVKGDGLEQPSFINAQFLRVSPEGVLEIEKVRGVNPVMIAGSEKFEFQGNVLDYEPILEANQIKHDRAGLLTRTQLRGGPEFGITLRASPELDSFHYVFGAVIEGMEVLDALAAIPTYTYSTSTGYGGQSKGPEAGLADLWFEGQKKLFVGAGKTFGDLRAQDRRGQLLRRVTIKRTGIADR